MKVGNKHYFIYNEAIEARDENFEVVARTEKDIFEKWISKFCLLSDDFLLCRD